MVSANSLLPRFAKTLITARESAHATPPLTREHPCFSIDEAYAVQAMLREHEMTLGRSIIGYKMGLTSRAKQRDVKVFEPICGYLTDAMELKPNQNLDLNTLIHPRIEPEIAIILKRSVRGAKRVSDLYPCLEFVGPAFEILDSRYENFSFQLSDVVADNTSASHFVLGTHNLLSALDDLPKMGVALFKNGAVIETATPAAVLGHPLHSVLMLASFLERQERELTEGEVILTGGLTASTTLGASDFFELVMPCGSVTFSARCE